MLQPETDVHTMKRLMRVEEGKLCINVIANKTS